MPVTFLAHQAPVLPIARRWPGRIDGIALVTGSMAPDMAYVLAGSRFNVWAHAFPALVLFCVPVALAVAWLIARVISPVLWDHLPDAGCFRLHDYRGLSGHRFRAAPAVTGAIVGAGSHVLLDHFTHGWGFMAQHVDWYGSVVIGESLGRQWTVFRIAQYTGHVLGSAACVWLLARYGRARWMEAAAGQVEQHPVTIRSRSVLVTAFVAGLGSGAAWVAADSGGSAVDVMRIAATVFVALVIGCAVLLRQPTRCADRRGTDRFRVRLTDNG